MSPSRGQSWHPSQICVDLPVFVQFHGFTEHSRQQIKEAMGADAQLLVKEVLNISPSIGEIRVEEAEI
jgi:hypothetical protein